MLLPSNFTADERQRLMLADLAKAEALVRVGVCFDCLHKLREALGVRSFLTRHTRELHGYRDQTRSQSAIRRAESNVRRWAKAYRKSFRAIDALNVSEAEQLGLQPLSTQDLTMLGSWLEGAKYVSSGRQLPWIWTIAPIQAEGPDVESEMAASVRSWNDEGE